MKKLILSIAIVILAVFTLNAAEIYYGPLYEWFDYQERYYEFQRDQTAQAMENLLEVYDKILKSSQEKGTPIPPGICADYGYVSLQAGDYGRGRELLGMEVTLYPESATLVQNLLRRTGNTSDDNKDETI